MLEDTKKLKKTMMNNIEEKNVAASKTTAMSTETISSEKPQVETQAPNNAANVEEVNLPSVVVKQKGEKQQQKVVKRGAVKSQPSKQVAEEARMLRIRCKQLCVSTFFQGQAPIRSLGFTSAIYGEGKSFLARLAAEVMAEDDGIPVTLLECNWDRPSLSSTFQLAPGPGLADWLLEECNLSTIRHQVSRNLTVIPAGDSRNNPVGLLRTLQQRGVLDVLTQPNEVLIIDLPAVTTTTYGQLAARLADTLILVVRMGVTPENFITETAHMLEGTPVQGTIFNQVTSHLPGWLRQLL